MENRKSTQNSLEKEIQRVRIAQEAKGPNNLHEQMDYYNGLIEAGIVKPVEYNLATGVNSLRAASKPQ